MADNTSLTAARAAKNDEFYTQYHDIEAEMNAYVEHDPDVFRDKVVLCPCDDPEWSNFTRYFAANFETFGLKKLVSTSYARGAANRQLSLFEQESPLYDAVMHETHGKVFVLERDANGSGSVDLDDLSFSYLEGDGDFRSDEVTRLRDEADVIVTNPPFSLFREFLAWVMEGGKCFALIGNQNAITYKEVFPLLRNNEVWLGTTHPKRFRVPEDADHEKVTYVDGVPYQQFGNVLWFTNLDHGARHEPLQLMDMRQNLKFNRRLRRKLERTGAAEYQRYVNYDAIEVPFTECIPSDYDGLMGVPITFLDKYCPEQFEIVGCSLDLAIPMSEFAAPKTYLAGGKRFYTQTPSESDAARGYLYHREYDRIVIRPRRKVDSNGD